MGVVPYGFTQNLPRGKYNRRRRYILSKDKYNFAKQNITLLNTPQKCSAFLRRNTSSFLNFYNGFLLTSLYPTSVIDNYNNLRFRIFQRFFMLKPVKAAMTPIKNNNGIIRRLSLRCCCFRETCRSRSSLVSADGERNLCRL